MNQNQKETTCFYNRKFKSDQIRSRKKLKRVSFSFLVKEEEKNNIAKSETQLRSKNIFFLMSWCQRIFFFHFLVKEEEKDNIAKSETQLMSKLETSTESCSAFQNVSYKSKLFQSTFSLKTHVHRSKTVCLDIGFQECSWNFPLNLILKDSCFPFPFQFLLQKSSIWICQLS